VFTFSVTIFPPDYRQNAWNEIGVGDDAVGSLHGPTALPQTLPITALNHWLRVWPFTLATCVLCSPAVSAAYIIKLRKHSPIYYYFIIIIIIIIITFFAPSVVCNTKKYKNQARRQYCGASIFWRVSYSKSARHWLLTRLFPSTPTLLLLCHAWQLYRHGLWAGKVYGRQSKVRRVCRWKPRMETAREWWLWKSSERGKRCIKIKPACRDSLTYMIFDRKLTELEIVVVKFSE